MKGDGSVYKRGNSYWLRFSVDGNETRISAETDKKEVAIKRLRDEVSKYRMGTFVPPATRKLRVSDLFSDLMDHYTLQGKLEYARCAKVSWALHLEPFFGRIVASQFGTVQQREYQMKRRKEEAAPATINKEIMLISAAFHLAFDSEPQKVLRVPKMLLLPVDNARKVFVTEEQWSGILKASQRDGLDFRVFLEMAYTLGWRKSEILRLRVGDINLAEGWIRLETSKNGEPREAPITPGLRAFLTQLVVGRKPEEQLVQAGTVQFRWDRACEAAGCPHLHIHDIRRTSARTKRARGVSTSVIMDLQGWKTEAMFRRYAITDTSDKLAALMTMERGNA